MVPTSLWKNDLRRLQAVAGTLFVGLSGVHISVQFSRDLPLTLKDGLFGAEY
jgi:hypothetical protein